MLFVEDVFEVNDQLFLLLFVEDQFDLLSFDQGDHVVGGEDREMVKFSQSFDQSGFRVVHLWELGEGEQENTVRPAFLQIIRGDRYRLHRIINIGFVKNLVVRRERPILHVQQLLLADFPELVHKFQMFIGCLVNNINRVVLVLRHKVEMERRGHLLNRERFPEPILQFHNSIPTQQRQRNIQRRFPIINQLQIQLTIIDLSTFTQLLPVLLQIHCLSRLADLDLFSIGEVFDVTGDFEDEGDVVIGWDFGDEDVEESGGFSVVLEDEFDGLVIEELLVVGDGGL